ncbi:MAG: 50S ribosomal protein L1 [Acidobacteriota bacterium]
MSKHGKQYAASRDAVEHRPYLLDEGITAVKESAYAKFDETVEIAINLGVNPRHADQMVRGTVVLPYGTGKTKRVVVIAQGEKLKEAEAAGADAVGTSELVQKISEGWLDFDAVVATPDMMRDVGKLGRILGPRGMMPNPKAGTVTFDVGRAVEEIKGGKLEFRVDKNGVVHAPVGRVSFDHSALGENVQALLDAIVRARPASAKGRYLESVHLSATMGPSVSLDTSALVPK